jgi:hypothetical protein
VRPKLGHFSMTDKDTAIRCQDYILELATKYDTVQMEVSKILQRTVKLALRRGWLKVSPLHACPLEIPMGKTRGSFRPKSRCPRCWPP